MESECVRGVRQLGEQGEGDAEGHALGVEVEVEGVWRVWAPVVDV